MINDGKLPGEELFYPALRKYKISNVEQTSGAIYKELKARISKDPTIVNTIIVNIFEEHKEIIDLLKAVLNLLLGENRKAKFYNVPPIDANFVEREEKIMEIKEKLLGNGGVVALTGKSTVGLYGMAGIGKTTLVRFIGHVSEIKEFYDGIIYQECKDTEFNIICSNIAGTLNISTDGLPPEIILQEVKAHFNRGKYCLILDDVRSENIKDLIPGGETTVLITSREKNYSFLTDAHSIELEEFTEEECFELFSKVLGDKLTSNEEDAEKIFTKLGRHPFAVAAGMLKDILKWKSNFVGLSDFLGDENYIGEIKYRDKNKEKLLLEAVNGLNSEEQELLKCIVVCDEKGCYKDFIFMLTDIEDEKAEIVLQCLHDKSLIKCGETSEIFSMHGLLRDVIKKNNDVDFILEKHLSIIHNLFKEWEEKWCECKLYISESLIAYKYAISKKSELVTTLYFNLDGLTYRTGLLPEAEIVNLMSEKYFSAKEDQYQLQVIYGKQALILKSWGKLEEAMELHKKKETICEELGNINDLAISLYNQATIHDEQGDIPTAKEKAETALKIFEELKMPHETGVVKRFLEGLR